MAKSKWEMITSNAMGLLWFVDREGAVQIFVQICATNASPEYIKRYLQESL